MPSIIPGFEYDIFISYRQKDNKYDGWVTEFVDNLKKELEATFKEEVSLYFDISPHDGLLETHDVDASLKEKLKCLVFIPIISRTYCDPKSFAWEHEFRVFVEKAKQDLFGLMVKLPGGNVAGRVLPVRIHDLDDEDIKLCESVAGGFLRGIEFIYREPGVNRPLRANEENPHDNLNRTFYRNQINKTALAIRDIIEGMKGFSAREKTKHKETHTEKIRIESPGRQETMKPQKRAGTEKMPVKVKRFRKEKRRSWLLIPAILSAIVILGTLVYLLDHYLKKRWAEKTALTQIEELINKADIAGAFRLVQKAERYISEDPGFRELESLASSRITVLTDPPGAVVYFREYSDMDGDWKKLGTTPIDSVKVPGSRNWWSSVIYLVKIEKPGFEDVLAVTSTSEDTLYRTLFREGDIPEGMVYIEEDNGFFIDRFEVSNKQYKEFVDNGGYRNPGYWKNEFRRDGKILSFDEATTCFQDKTGRPGPAYWEAGYYPEGQDNHPVSGISWYEAAAYAEYKGKSLPTSFHWLIAARSFLLTFQAKIIPFSNFNGKGPEPSGKNKGVSWFGAYDMAGNVREWCWNETPSGHIVRGGAWNDANYLFSDMGQSPSFDRSDKNGFRCVQYIDKEKIPENLFIPIAYSEGTDYSQVKPVEDDIYRILLNQFLYDPAELQENIESRDESHDDMIVEKITYSSPYGKERLIAYLFLPKNSYPPFQTLILFPGANAFFEKHLLNWTQRWRLIDYLLKAGRAVMCPVYDGTFDRIDEQAPVVLSGYQGREWVIRWVKDFRRSVDYLETRSDIDTSGLVYYGYSLGGAMGGVIPAVENRLKVNILIIGGFGGDEEITSYVPRIIIPTLMLNGRYDYTFPYETTVLPFYNLLGTPVKDKEIIIYETDHYVPRNEMIKEVLNWCDKYLGPVNLKSR